MIRLIVLVGLALVFSLMHVDGNLNKYINMKYAYLSDSAIVLLAILIVFEFIRLYLLDSKQIKENSHDHHDHHDHEHDHHHGHDHSHGGRTKFSRVINYMILIVPIFTALFLPIQTLDSSFVKAKGFSFPNFDVSDKDPGFHQFLKPDVSVFYGKQGYADISRKEMNEFQGISEVNLNDKDYLKGLEAVYNFPDSFIGRRVSFDGFVYKGEQVDASHAFIFRFGFIHCVADSGVFGMLVEFPKTASASLHDDLWVHVSGQLTWEFYQPFKQTLPMLKIDTWTTIKTPNDPYVYRT